MLFHLITFAWVLNFLSAAYMPYDSQNPEVREQKFPDIDGSIVFIKQQRPEQPSVQQPRLIQQPKYIQKPNTPVSYPIQPVQPVYQPVQPVYQPIQQPIQEPIEEPIQQPEYESRRNNMFSFYSILRYFSNKGKKDKYQDYYGDYKEEPCSDSESEDEFYDSFDDMAAGEGYSDSDKDDYDYNDYDYDSDAWEYEYYQQDTNSNSDAKQDKRGTPKYMFDKERINKKPLVKKLREITNSTIDPLRVTAQNLGLSIEEAKKLTNAWNLWYDTYVSLKQKLSAKIDKVSDKTSFFKNRKGEEDDDEEAKQASVDKEVTSVSNKKLKKVYPSTSNITSTQRRKGRKMKQSQGVTKYPSNTTSSTGKRKIRPNTNSTINNWVSPGTNGTNITCLNCEYFNQTSPKEDGASFQTTDTLIFIAQCMAVILSIL